MTSQERHNAIQLTLTGIMVAAWLGYLGYTLWRDYEARGQARQLRAMMERRQEELWERRYDTRQRADVVVVPEVIPAESDRAHP